MDVRVLHDPHRSRCARLASERAREVKSDAAVYSRADMLTVHHLENSRSHRVLWLLEELNLPYDVVRYARDPATMLAPDNLRAVHPLGKSPVVVDEGLVIAESAAILEYIVERHGQGRFEPALGSPERLRYRYWMHFAEGSLMPWMVLKLITKRMPNAPMPFFVRPVAKQIAGGLDQRLVGPNLKRALAFVESELGRSTWFAGHDLTACDMQMSFPLEASLVRAGVTPSSHPRIVSFVERIRARAAYQRALERGGALEPNA